MLSKIFKVVALSALSLIIFGCNTYHDYENENIIGQRLDVSSSASGADNTNMLSLFDDITRRVHTFDVQTLKLMMSTEVQNPEDKHYVIASDDESFFIDLSSKNLSLYNYNGFSQQNFVNFIGDPVSFAYHKGARTLAVYDDLNSVALVKVSEEGQIEKFWVGGPLVTGEQSIQAGDITENGELILSLINGSFAVVNIEASIDQQDWIYTLDTSVPDSNVVWLAGLKSDQVLYQSSDRLVLYDTSTQTVLDSSDLPVRSYPASYSKSGSAHIIYKEKYGTKQSLAYVKNGLIVERDFINLKGLKQFEQSHLDLNSGVWSYLGSGLESESRYGEKLYLLNENRHVIAHRLADMLVMSQEALPSEAVLKRSKSFVFALYPSELGYVEKIDILKPKTEVIRNFNIPFITPDMN